MTRWQFGSLSLRREHAGNYYCWSDCFWHVYGEEAVSLLNKAAKAMPLEKRQWEVIALQSDRIAEVGLDGWELVSVDGGTWHFKRPLPD